YRVVFRWIFVSALMGCLCSPAAFAAPKSGKKHAAVARKGAKGKRSRRTVHKLTPAQRARAARMKRAFVASSQLRPMAQQLLENRTPEAYRAVEAYARTHRSENSGTMAWMAVGYAHLLDKQYDAAVPALQTARLRAGDLGDYANLFLAQALNGSGQAMTAAAALADFDKKYPDSVLQRDAAIARADALIAGGEAATAVQVLLPLRPLNRPDIELSLGKAYAAAGDRAQATNVFSHLYLDYPMSSLANEAVNQLKQLTPDPLATMTLQQRAARADLLYKGRRYSEAAEELRTILNTPQVSGAANADRDLNVKLAGALYKSGRRSEALGLLDRVSEQPIDEAGAERLYIKAEEARNKDDGETNRKLVDQLFASNPQSIWTQEATLSAANMYLLRKDYNNAIKYYLQCAQADEHGKYAGYAHWKGTWLSFHTGDRNAARQLFLEQIAKWPSGQEIPATLYWSGRLAQEEGRQADAKAFYGKLLERYHQYYYGFLAEPQMRGLQEVSASEIPELASIQTPPSSPQLADPPEDDPRVAKARLLTNAGLNDYALRELKAAQQEQDGDWVPGELARLYLGERRPDRALRALKAALPGYFTYDLDSVPRFYWETLFPRPWWSELRAYSGTEGLDPYLVASLIRQESEFNPSAVSNKNAYGLMQLLPSAAKSMAKDLKIRHWRESTLTDPAMNLRLGTHYFRKLVDKYNGQVEYALAAYNAGDNRVEDWRAAGTYRDIYEFVESIPFTETREYVEAIERNAMIYSQLYKNGEPVVSRLDKSPQFKRTGEKQR
ncbi:MAG: transglycosylase SLT domain-containing protein, partial [Acidobacteriales bacterium]|nr:transglycosylase SLT domain-containing protein [Terriglobales bacterium]